MKFFEGLLQKATNVNLSKAEQSAAAAKSEAAKERYKRESSSYRGAETFKQNQEQLQKFSALITNLRKITRQKKPAETVVAQVKSELKTV